MIAMNYLSVFTVLVLVVTAGADVEKQMIEPTPLHCRITTPQNVNVTQDCDLTNSIRYCYTLFLNNTLTGNYEAYLRGCWSGGGPECLSHARKTPENAACLRRTGGGLDHLFCCCIGDVCNLDSRPLTPVLEENSDPTFPIEESIEELGEPQNLIFYTAFPGFALIIIATLSYIKRKRRKDLLAQRIVDETDEKTSTGAGSTLHPLENVTLVEPMVQGRFGTVWKAWHHDIPVAVKVVPACERQSWLNEVQVYCLPQMQHPNILRFIGISEQTNPHSNMLEYWLVTCWHEIGSLYDYLRFNTVTYFQLLHLADSIAKGIMHLHAEVAPTKYDMYKPAMAHRDIKSKNIIIKDYATACIADFGLAIKFEPGTNVGTAHSQVGTCRYMSPEVLEGAISFDQEAFQRIDIYAVALVLWEILSRTRDSDPTSDYKLPFEDLVGSHPSLLAMQDVVVNQKQRPPIKEAWRQNPRLVTFVTTLEDCWDTDSDARLSASTMHERFQHLIATFFPAENSQLDTKPLERTTILEIETSHQVV